jgi:hypothetical protein
MFKDRQAQVKESEATQNQRKERPAQPQPARQHEKGTKHENREQVGEAKNPGTDCIPSFITEMLENPPILPGECKHSFRVMFESFDLTYKERPKTEADYFCTFQATVAGWELMRYELMKVAIITNERPPAVESLHRRCAADPSTKGELSDLRKSAREGGMMYFTDPNYRKKFTAKLERAGFGPSAVEGAAFLRALPSLATIDRLIKSAEKRLADCQKKLEAANKARAIQRRAKELGAG